MQSRSRSKRSSDVAPGKSWRIRLSATLLILLAIGVVLITNRWLSERFTETTRNRAELRLALYSGNMLSEVQRTAVVPLLLADDPAIRDSLKKNSFSRTTLRLIEVQKEMTCKGARRDRYGSRRTCRTSCSSSHSSQRS